MQSSLYIIYPFTWQRCQVIVAISAASSTPQWASHIVHWPLKKKMMQASSFFIIKPLGARAFLWFSQSLWLGWVLSGTHQRSSWSCGNGTIGMGRPNCPDVPMCPCRACRRWNGRRPTNPLGRRIYQGSTRMMGMTLSSMRTGCIRTSRSIHHVARVTASVLFLAVPCRSPNTV